jgi:hypothetical protein
VARFPGGSSDPAQDFLQLPGVGPGGNGSFLGFSQLGRSHHFHGFSNLLCIFNAPDATLDITYTWHLFTTFTRLTSY